MAYTITFLRGADRLGSLQWAGDLASAEEHAHADFELNKSTIGVTSLAIADDDTQKVVYVYRDHPIGSRDASIPVEDLNTKNDE